MAERDRTPSSSIRALADSVAASAGTAIPPYGLSPATPPPSPVGPLQAAAELIPPRPSRGAQLYWLFASIVLALLLLVAWIYGRAA